MPAQVILDLQMPKDEVKIYTDSVRLKQVLNNLMNNAIKFTCVGHIRIGFVTVGSAVELFIEDTGTGIPKEHLEHIFDRFYKADSFKQGTGLGLAICKMIIESLHGRIQVASEFGTGTSVKIYLPRKV